MNPFNLIVAGADRSVVYACRFWSDQTIGWSCTVADSLTEAAEASPQKPPSMAVVDLQFCDREEAELAARLGAGLVIVSTMVDRETLDWIAGLSPLAFLVKPVERVQLLAALDLARIRLEAVQTAAESEIDNLVPVCANCHSVRNKEGDWLTMDDYLNQVHGLTATHSLCPACAQKLYPGLKPRKS